MKGWEFTLSRRNSGQKQRWRWDRRRRSRQTDRLRVVTGTGRGGEFSSGHKGVGAIYRKNRTVDLLVA